MAADTDKNKMSRLLNLARKFNCFYLSGNNKLKMKIFVKVFVKEKYKSILQPLVKFVCNIASENLT